MLELNKVKLYLNPVNFYFNIKFVENSITAIIGQSGAGKSTLINLISGFAHPDKGEILWKNKPITQFDPHLRPITSLFQEHNLFAHLNVFKNIALGLDSGLKLTATQINLVKKAIENVGLKGKDNKLPKDLSGGEAQRTALARALARAADKTNPRSILLLDEPFAALDPKMRQDMRQLVKQIQIEFNLTVLLVSHNPDEMIGFADTVITIENGKILPQ